MVDNFVKKGGILNCHDLSFLPSSYEQASKDESRTYEIMTLNEVVAKSNILLKHVCDGNGDNAIHVLFQNIQKKYVKFKNNKNKNKLRSKSMVNRKKTFKFDNELKGLKRLFSTCPQWLFSTNKSNNTPFAVLFDHENWDEIDNDDSNSIFANNEIMNVIMATFSTISTLVNDKQGMCHATPAAFSNIDELC